MPLTLSNKARKIKPSSTLSITADANALKASGVDVVGFTVGEPDFNTPTHISDYAIQAIKDGFTKYTAASGILELKEAICTKLHKFNHIDYAPNQIVVSNGAKHSLTNIFEAILNPGDEVIIPVPYWLTYPEIVKLADGIPVFIESTQDSQYKITADQIRAVTTENTKALILNTPSNPTGMLYTEQELREIAQVAIELDFYIIADEMYEYLTYDKNEHISIASLSPEIYERTITCSGISKSYAMTGWRIGYTASSVEIARLMDGIQSHQTSNPCSISQKAAYEAMMGDQQAMFDMVSEFEKRKNYMYQRLCQMPYIRLLEPQGAFYMYINCEALLRKLYKNKILTTVYEVVDILLHEYYVAVIPCEDFGAKNYIRLSFATSMDSISKGLDRIETFLNQI